MEEAARSSPGPGEAAPFVEQRADPAGRRLRSPTPRVALMLLAIVVVGFVLYLGRDALSPFIVGLLLVYLLDPPVAGLRRLGLPRSVAILVVYAVLAAVVVTVLVLTIPPLLQQIGQFFGDTPKLAALVQDQVRHLRDAYESLKIPPEVRATIDQALAQFGKGTTLNPGDVLPVFNSLAGFVASTFGYVIIPVWVFYLLKDRPTLTRAFDLALPDEWREDTWAVIGIAEHVFGQWVRGQIVLGSTVALATFVGLEILGAAVDPVFSQFALFLAILAGLLELLPIIGPIIAAIPLVLLGATASFQAAVAALLLAFVIQQLENYFLVPKIQGDAVKLHPSAVMFALIVGGAIAGLLGAILALPVTATGRDIYRYLFGRLSAPGAAAAAKPVPPLAEQPSGAQPSGAQPSGAQRAGAQPSGAQPSAAQPSGAQRAAGPSVAEPVAKGAEVSP
jgi:predicted PurR-regulated permease PerM